MSVVYKFLFPAKPVGNAFSLFLLALRILFGVLLLSHGIQKWTNFSAMSESFPDPLGVGSTLSLGLAVFAEVFCSVGFIFGDRKSTRLNSSHSSHSRMPSSA